MPFENDTEVKAEQYSNAYSPMVFNPFGSETEVKEAHL